MSQAQFNTQLTNQINVSDEAIKQLLALTESEDDVNVYASSYLVAVVAACLTV